MISKNIFYNVFTKFQITYFKSISIKNIMNLTSNYSQQLRKKTRIDKNKYHRISYSISPGIGRLKTLVGVING